jgi:hypothetical protein
MARRRRCFELAVRRAVVCLAVAVPLASCACAQTPVQPSQVAEALPAVSASAHTPIAIVPVDASATVTGALEITRGKAMIATAGSITSGAKATDVILPRRGTLRVCASTSVRLAADMSVPAGETAGLMMALDQGAVETSFATGRNADIVLTPDFRILIGGPGASDVKVRLGQHGDTCVDNPGLNAPYVLVSSVFDGETYRVQPGQRVMFQHGSLREVVDDEKEPCGCPPEPRPGTNDFPLAESAGLTPNAPPVTAPPTAPAHAVPNQTVLDTPLEYDAQPPAEPAAQSAPEPAAPAMAKSEAAPASAPNANPATQKKAGLFRRIGHFFKRVFGAE